MKHRCLARILRQLTYCDGRYRRCRGSRAGSAYNQYAFSGACPLPLGHDRLATVSDAIFTLALGLTLVVAPLACTSGPRPSPRNAPAHARAPKLPFTTDDVAYEERYPNPRINGRRPAGLANLMVWEVFDRSEQAEDPIRTSFWLVNARGQKFRLDRGGVERALRSVRFTPRDASEARRAATLRFSHHGDYKVMEGPLLPRVNAPREALSAVSAPSVTRLKGGRFRVKFDVFFSSMTARYFGQDNRSLSRCTAEVGQGNLSLRQHSLWSSFGTIR